MSGRSRMNDQRLRVSDVRQEAEELDRVDELLSRIESAANAETNQRACAGWRVFLHSIVVGARFESGIIHPFDLWMFLEVFCNFERIFGVSLHSQVQRLGSL